MIFILAVFLLKAAHKVRKCENGSRPRCEPGYHKEDNASPTATNESVFITAAIDAYEGHNVAYMDIPGAYLHTHTPSDKEIIMLMKGKLAEMIVLVNPKLITSTLFVTPRVPLYSMSR